MKLAEWIWDNRLNAHEFANRYGLSYQTVLAIVKNLKTPRMATALYVCQITKGEVSLKSMLTQSDSDKLASCVEKHL